MGTQAEVADLMPIITPFSLPEDPAGQTLYNIATAQVQRDAPGLSPNSTLLAQVYYIAHLMTGSSGGYGVTSEHLGQYSVSRIATEGSSEWLTLYRKAIDQEARAAIIARSARGVPHVDNRIADAMNLDASVPGWIPEGWWDS